MTRFFNYVIEIPLIGVRQQYPEGFRASALQRGTSGGSRLSLLFGADCTNKTGQTGASGSDPCGALQSPSPRLSVLLARLWELRDCQFPDLFPHSRANFRGG